MIEKEERNKIIALIKHGVVPAIGCTEPACVALCVAKACELACTHHPSQIELYLSANILKNAMGVGIPGTGMVGLPIAVALGALIGKSSYGLEVLKEVSPEKVEEGKKYIAEGRISIHLKENLDEKLYVEALVKAEKEDTFDHLAHTSKVIISGEHTRFTHWEADGKITLSLPVSLEEGGENGKDEPELSLKKVFEFATTAPLEEVDFIKEARVLNEKAAEESLKGNYGHRLGKTLSRPWGKGIMGESIFSHILSNTSCACDARMAGAMIPVMSNSGSGNQGICATNPVVTFAEENHNTDEELTRALILSHLTAIYIKQSLGPLSALCGCVVASTGSGCGITYLMGGGYPQVSYCVKNMVANLSGMLCDGAKPSCALKLTSGVSTAILSAMLAMENETVSSVEGIVDDDVDITIHNLTSIGKDAMTAVDRKVLDIMTHKSN